MNKVVRFGFEVLVFLLFVAVFAACAFGQDKPKSIRLPESTIAPPAPPLKIESNKLNKGTIYYVDSDIPVLVMAAPAGVVKIKQATATPVTAFGVFTDSKSTEPDFKEFKGKNVFFVIGLTKGTVTLFIIPKGSDVKEEDAQTKTLEVFPDEDPEPQPKPDPKPNPVPSDPFYDGIKAAYVADAMDSVKTQKLKEVYDYAVLQAESAATWGDLFVLMQSKAQELKVDGESNVPNIKLYLQDYLKKTLPSIGAGTTQMSFSDRVKAKTAFKTISDVLKEVLK